MEKNLGLAIYDEYGAMVDKYALLNILSYGWWDDASPSFNIYDYYLLTKEEWVEMLTIFINMSSYADVNQDFLRNR